MWYCVLPTSVLNLQHGGDMVHETARRLHGHRERPRASTGQELRTNSCFHSNESKSSRQHHINQHAWPTEAHHLTLPFFRQFPSQEVLHCVFSVDLLLAMAKRSSITLHLPTVALVVALVTLSTMVRETQAKCPSNDLTSCLPAAEADVQPSHECCMNLAAYTKSATPGRCLCEAALSSTFVNDENVVPLYALQIPQKCSLHYPAGTTCRGYAFPGGQ